MDGTDIINAFILKDAVILGPDHVVFCAVYEDALKDGTPISIILSHELDQWEDREIVPFEAVSMCRWADGLLVMGQEGDVVVVTSAGLHQWPRVGEGDFSGPFRKLKNIGGEIFAVGEDRGVFRWLGDRWTALSHGVPAINFAEVHDADEAHARIATESGIWFNLAGYTGSNLCVVGSDGEIWCWDGIQWTRSASPTNVLLTGIAPVGDGEFVVCGNRGIVLKGHQDEWQVLCCGNPELELCTVAIYRGLCYVADGRGLLVLKNDRLEAVDVGVPESIPVSTLVATDEQLLAMAAKEARLTRDGVLWQSLF